MYAATKANVRTAVAANDEGASERTLCRVLRWLHHGSLCRFIGPHWSRQFVLLLGGDPKTAHAIHGFGMGASVVALFSRVGGGIYTKSADVGATWSVSRGWDS